MDRTHAGSSWTAYYNIVCVVAGTGTLGLPYSLRQGGWIGILILFLAWFMSTVSHPCNTSKEILTYPKLVIVYRHHSCEMSLC